MKQVIYLILAGIIGGMITLAGVVLMENQRIDSELVPKVQEVNQNHIRTNVPGAADFSFVDAAERAMPAVGNITARGTASSASNGEQETENPFRYFFGDDLFGMRPNQPREGTGSGVLYSSDGYIITNNHVVQFAEELEVTLIDNRTFEARLIGTDAKSDLAVIKIEGKGFPTMELANSDNLKIGEWVLAVGNPFELNSTVTAGIVSAKGRNISLLGDGQAIESFIQTDAAVNPGNSGGALVDHEGRLVGINTAIATRTGAFEGYSFAIPINLVKRIADDIVKFGSYKRGFLGVSINELDSEYAKELGVDISQGVVIEHLFKGGSAQEAGLMEKDIVIAVNERSVKSVPELQEYIGRAKVGDVVELRVLRNGLEQDFAVRLKAQMQEEE